MLDHLPAGTLLPMLYRHSITIAAPIQQVWNLTVDVERWPDLTPTITSVARLGEGVITVGSRARLTQPRQRPRVWTVREVAAPHRFVWDSRVGLMKVTARHLLDEVPGGTRNTLEIEMSGLASRIAGWLAGSALRKALVMENEGFKQAAEAIG